MGAENELLTIGIGHEKSSVSLQVFQTLLENSIAHGDSHFTDAIERGKISFSDLRALAKKTRIPLPLFFSPLNFVEKQIQHQNKILISSFENQNLYMNSRESVDLRDVQLIVKDLIQKRETIKRLYKPVAENKIVSCLKRTCNSLVADTERLTALLNFDLAKFRSYRKKEDAFNYLVSVLENSNIYVSRVQKNAMPQQIKNPSFSGFLLKDKRIPYVFLANRQTDEFEEVAGRRIFTLMLLTVMLARGIYQPVVLSDLENETSDSNEYDLVGEILLPKGEMFATNLAHLEAITKYAEDCNVTPSAVVVRSGRLGIISSKERNRLLEALRCEWESETHNNFGKPKLWNSVMWYSGPEFSRRMCDALDSGKISQADYLRVATLNKLVAKQIPSLREAAYGY